MVLSSSKSGKPNDGDDRDDSANLTRPDMEAVGETEHVEHKKEGEDSGDLGQHDQHKITEEKPNGQSNEALQTVIASNTEAPPSSSLGEDVETNGAASNAYNEQQPKSKRSLSPKSSIHEEPSKKAPKVNTCVYRESMIDQGSDNDMFKQMADLLEKRDYIEAAVLQKKIDIQAANVKPTATVLVPLVDEEKPVGEDTEAKLKELLANRDFVGAAKLKAAAKLADATTSITVDLIKKQLESLKTECEAKIQGHVQKQEYEAAGDLDKNVITLESAMLTMFTNDNLDGARILLSEAMQTSWGKSLLARTDVLKNLGQIVAKSDDTTEQIQARLSAYSARFACTTAFTLLEDKRSKHEAVIQQFVANREFQALADYDKEMTEMEAEHLCKIEVAEKAEFLAKSLGVSVETDASGTSKETQVRVAKPNDTSKVISTCAHLFSTNVPIMERINIEHAQVLSVGKVCSVPNKGKNKNAIKGKNKGSIKGKQLTAKGKGKIKGNVNADGAERQDAVAIYIGQAGYIVCVLTFGSDVNCLPKLETLTGCVVDLDNVRAKVGQKGVLYCDEQSRLSECIQEHGNPMFEYHVSEVSQDMASFEFVKSMQVGDFVAMVLRINHLEEGETSNTGEPYLCIYGLDMHGITVGPIRLWRWTAADGGMQIGSTYVLRGLRVVKETSWSDDKWAYAPRDDGAMTVECNFRTAVEDVSTVDDIMALFE